MNPTSTARRKAALRAAGDWLLRMQDDDVGPAELEAWCAWMATPEHATAFDDLALLWEAAGTLEADTLLRARAVRNGASALPFPPPSATPPASFASAAATARREGRTPSGRRPRRAWAWAGAACVVLAATLAWFAVPRGAGVDPPQSFATAVGERRQITLADGSILEMDAATEVDVRYRADRRDIQLRHGRAYFQVAHAPERPFVVDANGILSQALGTRFSVARHDARGVTVVVDEGRVQVSASEGSPLRRYVATGNQRIRYSVANGLQPPQAVNAPLANAWRQGAVVYQGEPLDSVITDLNRYSRVPVRLQDPALGRLKVTGRWDVAGIDRWIDGLARALRLEVRRSGGEILLSSDGARNPPSARPAIPPGDDAP